MNSAFINQINFRNRYHYSANQMCKNIIFFFSSINLIYWVHFYFQADVECDVDELESMLALVVSRIILKSRLILWW